MDGTAEPKLWTQFLHRRHKPSRIAYTTVTCSTNKMLHVLYCLDPPNESQFIEA